MLDFSRVQNYFIACGYTDMRKQIDGVVAVVELQFGRRLDVTISSFMHIANTVLGLRLTNNFNLYRHKDSAPYAIFIFGK